MLHKHNQPPHLQPNSFPTRRSSDLAKKPTKPNALRPTPPKQGKTTVILFGLDEHEKPRGAQFVGQDEALLTRMRSEEHTSELQSPMYLVCRLLLEKKNIIQHQSSTK